LKHYQYILLDADETLFDFNLSEKTAIMQTFLEQEHFLSEEQYQIYHDINDALWRLVETGEMTQAQVRLERFIRFFNYYKLNLDAASIAQNYIKKLSELGLLFKGARELCETLHKSYKTALVSNGNSFVQRSRIKAADIEKYFDAVIISEEVHSAKPDARIFKTALKELGCPDNEAGANALMIGDSLVADIAGGINAGIDTCWYNPDNMENKTEFKPVYIANDYKDIIRLLNG
jgi:putative hydrolase of the HAD superfamily